MDTSDHGLIRRRRRTHSEEFKAKVVSACRQPGISMAAVALANGLNANLLRRWVVTAERTEPIRPMLIADAPQSRSTAESRAFVPLQLTRSPDPKTHAITIELRRGAMVVKVDWPREAAAECAGWLRELLR